MVEYLGVISAQVPTVMHLLTIRIRVVHESSKSAVISILDCAYQGVVSDKLLITCLLIFFSILSLLPFIVSIFAPLCTVTYSLM